MYILRCKFYLLAAAEVDLFSFDDAPVATPAQTSDNTFDAFQTAPAPTTTPTDDFGDFQEIAPTAPVQFDAFGSNSAPAPQTGGFDAFGGSSNAMNTMQQNQGMMMGNQQMGANMNAMNNAFGNMNMQNQQMPTTTPAAPANDDDFGDFAGADSSNAKSPEKSSDPLSSLISLDGLTKNVKKEKKTDETLGDKQNNPQMSMMNNPMGNQTMAG